MRPSVKLTIHSPEEMNALGHLVGVHYLNPLLNSGRSELQSLVFAAYARGAMGKSHVFRGALAETSPSYPWEFKHNGMPEEYSSGPRSFRHFDYGQFLFLNRDMPYAPGPRKELKRPGVDFLENPPLSKVDSPGLVLTIVSPDSADYFVKWKSRLKDVRFPVRLPHRVAYDLVSREFPHEVNPNSPRGAAAHKALEALAAQHESRKVTLAPTTGDKVASEAFRNLAQHVRDHFKAAL